MCGRYYVEEEDVEEMLRAVVERTRPGNLPVDGSVKLKTGEIFPTDAVRVIANSRALIPSAYAMRWGISVSGAPVINARSETALTKPLFRESAQSRRCLVPVSYYFEWEKRGEQKLKYAIRPRCAAYLAGLYRLSPDGSLPSFAVLTRDASPDIAFIHDRMPVIIERKNALDWLCAKSDFERLLALSVDAVSAKRA